MCSKKFSILIFCAFIMLQSCNTIDVYEHSLPLTKHEWDSNTKLNFTCTIKDTAAYYNIYLVLRHTESYHFNNIWINFSAVFPKDTTISERLSIQLASGNGWLGTSMDDIIEQRLVINKQPVRLNEGTYKFSLLQVMREDPLQNVLNAGIRVEKVTQ